jgi:hypothetical protein
MPTSTTQISAPAIKPTKKAFRELMNVWFADTKWRNYRYHNRVRLYGDYLYDQDPDMFNEHFVRWVRGGCPTDLKSWHSC